MDAINPLATATTLLVAAVLASACGGSPDAAIEPPQAVLEGSARGGATDAAAASARPASTSVAPPLLADDGSPMPSVPRAVPTDSAAWTRSGRYATPLQAEQLESALGGRVLRVLVECCGLDGAERAVGNAFGLQAAQDLPLGTPVLVHAADLRMGAAVANRLADEGYGLVWLVTH